MQDQFAFSWFCSFPLISCPVCSMGQKHNVFLPPLPLLAMGSGPTLLPEHLSRRAMQEAVCLSPWLCPCLHRNSYNVSIKYSITLELGWAGTKVISSMGRISQRYRLETWAAAEISVSSLARNLNHWGDSIWLPTGSQPTQCRMNCLHFNTWHVLFGIQNLFHTVPGSSYCNAALFRAESENSAGPHFDTVKSERWQHRNDLRSDSNAELFLP